MDEVDRLKAMTALAASAAAPGNGEAAALPPADPPRIVSLLPAATDIAFALGLADSVVGVSHECRIPPHAGQRPAVVRPAVVLDGMTQRQIDAAVAQRLTQGQSLYAIDEALLQHLRPDLVLTQDLCQACAPSGNQLTDALASLSPRPKVLALTPHTLGDILQNILDLGCVTGRVAAARLLVQRCRERLAAVRAAVPPSCVRPRVFFMEWTDPVYSAGHWVPEMIELAGGVDDLARAGEDSVRLAWEDVTRWSPEVLIVAPCGCDSAQAFEQLSTLASHRGWSTLPAVERNQVYCVDANSYFACPGPRVFEGIELLAHLIHPERFGWSGPEDAYRRLPSQRQA